MSLITPQDVFNGYNLYNVVIRLNPVTASTTSPNIVQQNSASTAVAKTTNIVPIVAGVVGGVIGNYLGRYH